MTDSNNELRTKHELRLIGGNGGNLSKGTTPGWVGNGLKDVERCVLQSYARSGIRIGLRRIIESGRPHCLPSKKMTYMYYNLASKCCQFNVKRFFCGKDS